MYVARDGTISNFINLKSKSLFLQKKKPSKIGWTPASRILHKKGKSIVGKRRRAKKAGINSTAKRAIGSLTVDEIRSRRNQTKDFRAAQRSLAVQCVPPAVPAYSSLLAGWR